MARWRHAVELALTDEEIKSLGAIARSRSDPARRVERARMLLVYRENFSFFAVGQRLGVHHQTVERCVERRWPTARLRHSMTGPDRARSRRLRWRPRPGWCLWHATRPRSTGIRTSCGRRGCWRAMRARTHRPRDTCLANLAQGTVCKILGQEEIKPHKVRYYLERRDR